MTTRSYRTTPDGRVVVDIDRGYSDDPTKKQAMVVREADFIDRERTRRGARELDVAIESMALTRAAKDLNRAYPRSTVTEIDGRKRRRLPREIELRRSLSSRQRKARSVTKHAVQETLPATQYAAVRDLIADERAWADTNEELSNVAGDAVMLDDARRKQVQRVDRAIQAYERESGRGHVVYVAVTMPDPVTDERGLPSTLTPGSVVSIDRFTACAHSLHELDARAGPNDVVLEIETTRGMYLGYSDSLDDTTHLLPRGLVLRVGTAHLAPYEKPSAGIGERVVVQMRDYATPDSAREKE